jgi:hypothetical protein
MVAVNHEKRICFQAMMKFKLVSGTSIFRRVPICRTAIDNGSAL